jgi:hypothetical protein
MGGKYEDPLQAQAQAEAQAQLEAQLQAQGQGQHQGQGQYQSSESDNFNGNGNLNGNGNFNGNANLNGNGNFNGNANLNANENDNHNANCNTNENVNFNSTCVDVKVDVSASVTPIVGENNEGSVINIPQTFNQYIDWSQNGDGGGGAQTEIALDQINSLVASNSASDIHNSDWSHACATADNSGDASVQGGIAQGDLSTGALTANTSTNATADAFTQSIVLGANLQNNSFSATVAGHDSHVEVHHS